VLRGRKRVYPSVSSSVLHNLDSGEDKGAKDIAQRVDLAVGAIGMASDIGHEASLRRKAGGGEQKLKVES
jgi:hypothetical protein